MQHIRFNKEKQYCGTYMYNVYNIYIIHMYISILCFNIINKQFSK